MHKLLSMTSKPSIGKLVWVNVTPFSLILLPWGKTTAFLSIFVRLPLYLINIGKFCIWVKQLLSYVIKFSKWLKSLCALISFSFHWQCEWDNNKAFSKSSTLYADPKKSCFHSCGYNCFNSESLFLVLSLP